MDDAAREGTFHKVLVDTGAVRIGAFRCHPEHAAFANSGPARDFCFVFPRTSVEIAHENVRPFVANPNVVTFYNRGQEYRRAAVSAEGDRCDWFAVDPEIARDVVRAFDPRVDDRPERPFRLARGASDERTYLAQRQLFEHAAAIDAFAVEEEVVRLLERVLRVTYARPPRQCEVRRDAIDHVERLLSAGWERPLRDLAREAGLSPYQLCRAFRRATGQTLHRYRAGLRLRSALEAVRAGEPLVDVALGAGYSSHSHFTSAFREAFGRTPGQLRGRWHK